MPGITVPAPVSLVPSTQQSPGSIISKINQLHAAAQSVKDPAAVQTFTHAEEAFNSLQTQTNSIMNALRAPLPQAGQLYITDASGALIGWIGYQAIGGVNYEGAWFANIYLGGTSPANALVIFTSVSDTVTINGGLTVNNGNVLFNYTGPGFQTWVIGGTGAIFNVNPYATHFQSAFQYEATSGGLEVLMSADGGLTVGNFGTNYNVNILPTTVTLSDGSGNQLVVLSTSGDTGTVTVGTNGSSNSAVLSVTPTTSSLQLNNTLGSQVVLIDAILGYSSPTLPLTANKVISNSIFEAGGFNGLSYTATIASTNTLTFTGGILTNHT